MIYILTSIVLFALNNVLWKKNLQNSSVPFLIGYRAFFTTTLATSLLLYMHGFEIYQNQPIGKITLGSLFGVLGLFCMLTVLKKAPLQWLGIYNLIGIFFTALYLYFFENTPVMKSILGLIIIVVGFLFYVYFNRESETKISPKQHLVLLVMTLSFGISSLIHWKNLGTKVPAILIISNQELVVFISATLLIFFTLKTPEIKFQLKSYFSKAIMMALVIFLALLFSFLGLQVSDPLISSILFLATPLLTIVFGTLFYKEKMSLINSISILIIAAGAFILHYQNS
ncbi:MAG: EamA family transporter [Flavobacterium sp.]|nr:EamA family transporter [Flavobacterium sp.]